MESAPGAEATLNGRRYLYFAGTGYLGLQGRAEVVEAAEQGLARYGIHTATSRSGYGTPPPVREVEQRSARLLGTEEALYLASGYAGNFAVLAALSPMVDVVLLDEHAHDSLREATRWLNRLAIAPLVHRHLDVAHVEELLEEHAREGRRALLLADGVFAVSGHLAPLAEYLRVLARYPGSMLHVDDAHGLGSFGILGRGSLELAGVASDVVNRAHDARSSAPQVFHAATLSKAIGGYGGVIAGDAAFLEAIKRASGWFRGASAPAAPVAAATAKCLELVEAEPELRAQLARNVTRLRGGLRDLGLDVEQSPSPIIGWRLSSAGAMQRVSRRLAEVGILIGYTRDYSGAGPDGMLRIAVFATHTSEMLERLVAALQVAVAEENKS